ncbi:MAG: glycosyltransferase family 4 protein [Candidatus Micrarchaeia archaeon]
MDILIFVHTYGERNGISNHVLSLAKSLPSGMKAHVISGRGLPFPGFSSLRLPFFELFEALGCRFDLIHIHGYGNFHSFFGAVLSLLKGKPLVWTIHGYPRMKGARRLFYYVYRYLMAPFIFWRASRVVSVSSDIVPLLEKETSKKVTVMPNGVDLGHFKPSSGYRDARQVCYVGRLDPDKGAARLLECSSFPLLFIGPDEDGEKERISALAAKLGRKAEFSECPFDRMPSQYERCRYVVLPSKYEGFPLTLLESVAMGRPFISSDVGEVKATLSSLFPKPSRYLLHGDVGKKISELEEDDWSGELKSARKRLEAYSWKSVARRTSAIYAEAAHAKLPS